ncbi:hypothetical protein J6590_092977 [Homalodisca vitripennis]|nr:hypothetical protein J6590_092977 [Homalodisca vitripennis]
MAKGADLISDNPLSWVKIRVEGELAFFNRSSRTPRSPPQTSVVSGRKAELGTVSLMAQAISPPPATFKFTGSNPENPSHPEDVETELLKGMSNLVESMLQTLKVQRNVNSGIKEGHPKLKDQLQQMMDLVLRRLKQRAGTSEKKLPGRKRARRAFCPSPEAKSPSDQRPTISTMERATQVFPRVMTRPQDASERELPPDSKPSGDGEWRKRLSQKERWRMKRAEAACKEQAVLAPPKALPHTPVKGSQREKPPLARKRPRPGKHRSEAILIKPLGGDLLLKSWET